MSGGIFDKGATCLMICTMMWAGRCGFSEHWAFQEAGFLGEVLERIDLAHEDADGASFFVSVVE